MFDSALECIPLTRAARGIEVLSLFPSTINACPKQLGAATGDNILLSDIFLLAFSGFR
jgi:hypothetical protein